ncbi:unnamed protein product [Trichobilharzia szidati]|nr:unnamed protein product [Trichobilharzia szidati]
MNPALQRKQFASKEKLFHILTEFQALFTSPFRLSEATRWCESYFKRNGGNVEAVGVFLDFILSLGFIHLIDQGIFSHRYAFNVERMNEFFGSCSQPENQKPKNDKNPEKNADQSVEQSLDGSLDISIHSWLEGNCAKSTLTNARSHLWFDEIITRLSCLLDTDRDELIVLIEQSEPSISDSCTSSSPKMNSSLPDMGTAAYTNSLASEKWHRYLKNATGELVDLVAVAALDALSKWPDNFSHRPGLCENKCSPSSLLSIAISYVEDFESSVPKPTELLLDFIFSSWSNANLLATMNGLLKSWINNNNNNHTPNKKNSNSNERDRRDFPLPPLASPVVDRNRNNALSGIRRTPSSPTILKPSISNSIGEYQPVSPSDLVPAMSSCRLYQPSCKYENIKRQVSFQSHRLTRRHSEYHLSLPTSHSSASNQVGTPLYGRYSNFSSFNLKNRSSSTHYSWPVMECYDLAVATQLTLLFLPPVVFFRLKIVVDLLRRVLSNHERLASLMMNTLSCRDCERSKSIDISMLDSPSTLEITMQAIVKLFGPLLLHLPSDDSDADANSRIRWRECLLYLLLCDSENFLLTPPANVVCDLRRVTTTIMGSDDVDAEQENIFNVERLIELISSSSCISGELRGRRVHSPSKIDSLPACIPSIRSRLTVAMNLRDISLVSPEDNSVKCASTPSVGCRINSLENSLRHINAGVACRHRSSDKDSFDDGNESATPPRKFLFGRSPCRPVLSGNISMENSPASSTSSVFFQSDLDPKRLALLGNTAHLIKLLNQIINDRDMNPRRKMKCLQDFRKSHPDVFWLRFGSEQTAASYMSRLQRRIDSQSHPSVFERITNALRRRRQSPLKQQDPQRNGFIS